MKDGSQPCPLGEKINKTSNIGYLKYPSNWENLNNKPIVKKEFPKKHPSQSVFFSVNPNILEEMNK
jgi:hypothetical protein